MHGHVVAHGHDFARAIKHRAGIVATLFDVGGKRGAAQRRAHLFRNRVEKTFEDLQFNGIAHGQSAYHGCAARSSRSAATKTKNTTAITPFMVKNAALSLERSPAETSECSYASNTATTATPANASLPRPKTITSATSNPSISKCKARATMSARGTPMA